MMKIGNKMALILSGFLLHGCASSDHLTIEELPKAEANISKILKEPQVRVLKRKVAIARFSNETKYGQGFLLDENKDPVGKQAMDILSARLTETEKFLMFERGDLDKVVKEMKLGNMENTLVNADYIIVGSVSEFGRNTTSDVGVFNRSMKQTVTAKVNVRLVDVATGQIIHSEEGAGSAVSDTSSVMGVGSRASYDASLNDKAISAAISKVVNNLIERMSEKPWRTFILSSSGGQTLISGGKTQGIHVGDIFSVMQKGEKVKNPQTGFMIELPGKEVAKMRVASLIDNPDPNSEISMVEIISGAIQGTKPSDLFIVESSLAK
ncbi:MAG: Curli production assembly/transport component CsgG [Magnetococcales bacterium]|nr:Curli production assembly/transport component CsgG [Magnetococcales bacterium]